MIKLFAECHADTLFSKFLFTDCDTDHEYGHGPTLDRLEKENSKNPIAFIDKSKTFAPFFNESKQVKYLNIGVQLRVHTSGKKIIYLENGIEAFIIDLCSISKIDISNYKLPTNPKLLGNRLKSITIDNDPNFKGLLNTIKQKKLQVIDDLVAFIKQ